MSLPTSLPASKVCLPASKAPTKRAARATWVFGGLGPREALRPNGCGYTGHVMAPRGNNCTRSRPQAATGPLAGAAQVAAVRGDDGRHAGAAQRRRAVKMQRSLVLKKEEATFKLGCWPIFACFFGVLRSCVPFGMSLRVLCSLCLGSWLLFSCKSARHSFTRSAEH